MRNFPKVIIIPFCMMLLDRAGRYTIFTSSRYNNTIRGDWEFCVDILNIRYLYKLELWNDVWVYTHQNHVMNIKFYIKFAFLSTCSCLIIHHCGSPDAIMFVCVGFLLLYEMMRRSVVCNKKFFFSGENIGENDF